MALSNRNIAIACLILTSLLCHTESSAQFYVGAVGTVNTGYISTNKSTSAINSLVSDSVHFRNGYTLIGVEGYYCQKRAIVFISGCIGFQKAQPQGKDLVEPFTWNAHSGFGWIVSKNEKFALYPSFGIGATGLSASRYVYTNKEAEDIQIIAPSMEVAFHVDFLLTDPCPSCEVVSGIVLGLKAGYNRGFKAVYWQNEDRERGASISPSQFQGWYITVSVGGLAFLKKGT